MINIDKKISALVDRKCPKPEVPIQLYYSPLCRYLGKISIQRLKEHLKVDACSFPLAMEDRRTSESNATNKNSANSPCQDNLGLWSRDPSSQHTTAMITAIRFSCALTISGEATQIRVKNVVHWWKWKSKVWLFGPHFNTRFWTLLLRLTWWGFWVVTWSLISSNSLIDEKVKLQFSPCLYTVWR